jgi:hypothetical protein
MGDGKDDVVGLGTLPFDDAERGLGPMDRVVRLGVTEMGNGGVDGIAPDYGLGGVPKPVLSLVAHNRAVANEAIVPRMIPLHDNPQFLRRIHDQSDAPAIPDKSAVDEELFSSAYVGKVAGGVLQAVRDLRARVIRPEDRSGQDE